MRNTVIILSFSFFIFSCKDGSQLPFDENFIRAEPKNELPYKNLIGTYKLDTNSKKRYKINDSTNLELIINKDTTFTVKNLVDYKDRKIKFGTFKFKAGYINNFEDNKPSLFLNTFSKDFNGNGIIDIYYRKKDSAIALYILTPFIPATKENNMKYMEADYLRYIKVK